MISWVAVVLNAFDQSGRQGRLDAQGALKAIVTSNYGALQSVDSPMRTMFDDIELDGLPEGVEWRLVRAFLWSTLEGYSERGVEELSQVRQDPDVDIETRAAAGLFASVASTDIPSVAIEFVASALSEFESAVSPLTRVALRMQYFLHACELGSFSDANEQLTTVQHALEMAYDSGLNFENQEDVDAGMGILADSLAGNRVDIERVTEPTGIVPIRYPSDSASAWNAARRRVDFALRGYVDERFRTEIRDSATFRTAFRFGFDDSITNSLYAYLTICQVSGYWKRCREANALLGKETLLRRSAASLSEMVQGLSLLRRAHDYKAYESALLHVRAQGSLEAITREFVTATSRLSIGAPWRTDLAALRIGAVCADEEASDSTIEKLLGVARAHDWVRDPEGSFRVAHVVWNSIAALIDNASNATVSRLALRALEAARDSDSLTLNRLNRITNEIDWRGISDDIRNQWITWAAEQSVGDSQTLALSVLGDIASIGSPAAVSALESMWSSGGSLLLAAVSVDIAGTGEESLARSHEVEIAGMCFRDLESMRHSAAAGVHSVGGIDSIFLATKFAALLGRLDVWSAVADILCDANVYWKEKDRSLNWMAANGGAVPVEVVRTIGSELPAPDSIVDTDDPFESVNMSSLLRFMNAFELVDDARAVAWLLELSGSARIANRVDAAHAARSFRSNASRTVILGALLQLIEDSAVVVRTAATRQLSHFFGRSGADLDALIVRKMRDKLGADGLSEPLSVLRGLAELGPQDRLGIVARLADKIEALVNSPSYLLRRESAKLLEESIED